MTRACWLIVLGGCGLTRVDVPLVAADTSRDAVCPVERTHVQERADLHARDLVAARAAAPPPIMASDPERLALWRDQQRARADLYADWQVFQIDACDRHGLFLCTRATDSEGTLIDHSKCVAAER